MEYAQAGTGARDNDATRQARRGRINDLATSIDVPDESLRYVRYVEAIVRLDRDNDGIAERYRAVMLGETPKLISLEPGDDCYYVISSPIRRPHEPIGAGQAENLIDIQDQLTALLRGWLNGLNRANNPREVVSVDDTTAYESIQSPFGGPIRAMIGRKPTGWIEASAGGATGPRL